MISPKLRELERSIQTFSLEEQLWLLEQIARRVREQTLTSHQFDRLGDRELAQQ